MTHLLISCIVFLLILVVHVDAFSVQKHRSDFSSPVVVFQKRQQHLLNPSPPPQTMPVPSTRTINTSAPFQPPYNIASKISMWMMGLILLPQIATATTEVELAELPPPWIPVVFGVGLVAGVGLLTGSLGDVIEQESLLGLQSGARAKKEIDRSRASYFKKK